MRLSWSLVALASVLFGVLPSIAQQISVPPVIADADEESAIEAEADNFGSPRAPPESPPSTAHLTREDAIAAEAPGDTLSATKQQSEPTHPQILAVGHHEPVVEESVVGSWADNEEQRARLERMRQEDEEIKQRTEEQAVAVRHKAQRTNAEDVAESLAPLPVHPEIGMGNELDVKSQSERQAKWVRVPMTTAAEKKAAEMAADAATAGRPLHALGVAREAARHAAAVKAQQAKLASVEAKAASEAATRLEAAFTRAQAQSKASEKASSLAPVAASAPADLANATADIKPKRGEVRKRIAKWFENQQKEHAAAAASYQADTPVAQAVTVAAKEEASAVPSFAEPVDKLSSDASSESKIMSKDTVDIDSTTPGHDVEATMNAGKEKEEENPASEGAAVDAELDDSAKQEVQHRLNEFGKVIDSQKIGSAIAAKEADEVVRKTEKKRNDLAAEMAAQDATGEAAEAAEEEALAAEKAAAEAVAAEKAHQKHPSAGAVVAETPHPTAKPIAKYPNNLADAITSATAALRKSAEEVAVKSHQEKHAANKTQDPIRSAEEDRREASEHIRAYAKSAAKAFNVSLQPTAATENVSANLHSDVSRLTADSENLEVAAQSLATNAKLAKSNLAKAAAEARMEPNASAAADRIAARKAQLNLPSATTLTAKLAREREENLVKAEKVREAKAHEMAMKAEREAANAELKLAKQHAEERAEVANAAREKAARVEALKKEARIAAEKRKRAREAKQLAEKERIEKEAAEKAQREQEKRRAVKEEAMREQDSRRAAAAKIAHSGKAAALAHPQAVAVGGVPRALTGAGRSSKRMQASSHDEVDAESEAWKAVQQASSLRHHDNAKQSQTITQVVAKNEQGASEQRNHHSASEAAVADAKKRMRQSSDTPSPNLDSAGFKKVRVQQPLPPASSGPAVPAQTQQRFLASAPPPPATPQADESVAATPPANANSPDDLLAKLVSGASASGAPAPKVVAVRAPDSSVIKSLVTSASPVHRPAAKAKKVDPAPSSSTNAQEDILAKLSGR